MEVILRDVGNVLTRTTGFLKTVTSHSLQPYRGCTFGNSLCGVGCYVRHNPYVTRGRAWGSFLEVRENAAASYRRHWRRERTWARRVRRRFGVFLSSSTEPFLPQEFRYRVTGSVLEAMLEQPPDLLVLQTHSHRVTEYTDLYLELSRRCRLRVHISIETDLDAVPGLPGHASTVDRRFDAARRLKRLGLFTVITVSPLLPIRDPERFFHRISEAADRVVIDHFIEGDGTADGSRTLKTALPRAMKQIDEQSTRLAYRDRMVQVAQKFLPGRVGVSIDGFAGRYLTSGRSIVEHD
jgi:DNA repair photolyase